MAEAFTIADKFRGPHRSGNGGYVAGVVAGLLDADGPAEVTLRAPVPLDEAMGVQRGQPLRILHGEVLIAEARPAELELAIPTPPSWDEALALRPASLALKPGVISLIPNRRGFHPVCFCCGADHPEGLQVFPAAVDDGAQVVAAWQTRAAWGDEHGRLPAPLLWTALDCPGQFAYMAAKIRTGLLGRITAQVFRPAAAGENYVVTGWRIGVERRKHFAGTAVFASNGEIIAAARSVWIGRVDSAPAGQSNR